MAELDDINNLIEMARENFPSVRYNHKMLEFLMLQMQKLEHLENIVQKKRLRKQAEGAPSPWRNLYKVIERGELLIRRHAEPFDLQKFYKVATVEEGVKDLCGGLRNCVEELTMDGWLPQGRVNIKYHLEEARAKEDRTYMYWYLAYILDGKQSGLQLDEATRKEWEGLKTEHEGRMERLLLIGDSERDKIHWGKPIGSGGNSQVFSARWRDIDVAVKKLADSERHLSQEALASFFTEVEIQMGMNYPFVVRLYAVSRTGLMLMELATSNLAVVYQQEMSMTWTLKAKLLAQAAQGLEYVHDRGVVHRDVKSLNFLVFGNNSATYTVKVADFGLAYMKTETQSKTGRQLGSPLWMAPEVHEGKFHTFNSDVFSFGVVMFEVAAQMLPYRGATPEVLLGRKRRKRDPCVVPEDCPEELLKLMRACITPDPHDRPNMKYVATKLNEISRQCQEGASSKPSRGGYLEDEPVAKVDPLSDLETHGSRAQRQGPVGSYSAPRAERQGPVGTSSVSRAQRHLPVGSSSASKWFSRFSRQRQTESAPQAPPSPAARRTPSPSYHHRETHNMSGSDSYNVPDGIRSAQHYDMSSLYTNHDGYEHHPSYMVSTREQRPPVPVAGGRRPHGGRDGYSRDPGGRDPPSREYRDPPSREYRDPLSREYRDPVSREYRDPISREYREPVSREYRDPVSREYREHRESSSREFREPNSREFRDANSRDFSARDPNSRDNSSRGSRGSSLFYSSMSATTEEWIRGKEIELKRNQD
ncbi:unnamed protein product, partial [Ostreobium quekettii]